MPKRVPKARAKTKTLPCDVATQLRTPEERAAYLGAWQTEASDDVEGIARALRDVARARYALTVERDENLDSEENS